jgi:hypothetical protein
MRNGKQIEIESRKLLPNATRKPLCPAYVRTYRFAGGEGVASSNLVGPTINLARFTTGRAGFFVFEAFSRSCGFKEKYGYILQFEVKTATIATKWEHAYQRSSN